MRSMLRPIVIAVAVSLTACGGKEGPPTSPLTPTQIVAEGITIDVVNERLVLRNTSAERIRFGALERVYFETLLASWCFGTDDCGSGLDAGQTASLQLSDIGGYTPAATELTVFWWPVRPDVPPDERHQLLRQVVIRVRD
jgi:hypothetical protein